MTWKKNSLHREEDESIWENVKGWIITCSLNHPVLNRVVFKQIPIGSCQNADIRKCHLVDTGRAIGTEILNQKILVFEVSIFQLQVWITGRMPESLYCRAKWDSKAINVPGGRGESKANTDLLRVTFRDTAMLCSSSRKILVKTWL